MATMNHFLVFLLLQGALAAVGKKKHYSQQFIFLKFTNGPNKLECL